VSVRLWPELARARTATYIEPTESASVSQRAGYVGRVVLFAWIHLTQLLRGRPAVSRFISRLLILFSNHHTYSNYSKRVNDNDVILSNRSITLLNDPLLSFRFLLLDS